MISRMDHTDASQTTPPRLSHDIIVRVCAKDPEATQIFVEHHWDRWALTAEACLKRMKQRSILEPEDIANTAIAKVLQDIRPDETSTLHQKIGLAILEEARDAKAGRSVRIENWKSETGNERKPQDFISSPKAVLSEMAKLSEQLLATMKEAMRLCKPDSKTHQILEVLVQDHQNKMQNFPQQPYNALTHKDIAEKINAKNHQDDNPGATNIPSRTVQYQISTVIPRLLEEACLRLLNRANSMEERLAFLDLNELLHGMLEPHNRAR